jgi:4-carboxymuconolactone decarboxylase
MEESKKSGKDADTRPPERMGPLPDEALSPAQQSAWTAVIESRGRIGGPFVPLLRSPELLNRLQHLGAYLRFESALPAHLSELVILIVARAWTANFEWAVHVPIARKAGLDDAIIDAISAGARPVAMSQDVMLVHDFCIELLHNRCVSDRTYDASVMLFGEQGVVDMTAIAGYYATLAMVMNVARTPPPPDAAAVLRPLP